MNKSPFSLPLLKKLLMIFPLLLSLTISAEEMTFTEKTLFNIGKKAFEEFQEQNNKESEEDKQKRLTREKRDEERWQNSPKNVWPEDKELKEQTIEQMRVDYLEGRDSLRTAYYWFGVRHMGRVWIDEVQENTSVNLTQQGYVNATLCLKYYHETWHPNSREIWHHRICQHRGRWHPSSSNIGLQMREEREILKTYGSSWLNFNGEYSNFINSVGTEQFDAWNTQEQQQNFILFLKESYSL